MRKITKIRRSVRAISPIIATLLLIAIAVVASLVAYAWIMGYIGVKTSRAGNGIQIQSFTTSGNLVIYVQNTGIGTVHLLHDSSVYVNNVLYGILLVDGKDASTGQLDPIPIPQGQTVELVINFQPTPNEKLNIKIVTVEGTTITGSTTAGSETTATVTFGMTGQGSGSSISPTGTQTYNVGSVIQVTATAGSGDAFSYWSSSAKIQMMNDQSAETLATINGDGSVTGNFVSASNPRLVVTIGQSQVVTQNQMSNSITIQREQDQTGAIQVTLQSSSSGGVFYQDAAGSNQITGPITISDQGGTATFCYKDSNVGMATLTFSATGYSPGTTTFTIAGTAPTPTPTPTATQTPTPTPTPAPVATTLKISPSGSTSITAGGSQAYIAQAFDQNGNSMGDVTSSATFSANGAQISGNTVSENSAGTYTITASYSGMTSDPATLQVNPGSATNFDVSGFPNPTTAGVSHSITVTAYDSHSNIATGYVGTVKLTSSDTQAALPSVYQFTSSDAGAHSFSVTLITTGTQSVTATDTATSSITGLQSGITVNPSGATSLIINPGTTSIQAGGSQTYTAIVYDSYHNSWDVTSSAAFSVNGVPISSNTVSETAIGSYTVTASYGTLTSNSATLQVTGGTIVSIQVSPGSPTIIAGGSQAFTATASDQYSNTWDVTGQVVWSINSATGSANWNGATVTVSEASAAGTPWTVTASLNDISGTAQLTVSDAAITSIQVTPSSQSITAGGSQAFTATAFDQYGNAWDVTTQVTWTINSAQNSFQWSTQSIGTVTVTQASVPGTPWTVTATLGMVSSTAQLTVNHLTTITDLEVAPAQATMTAGGTGIQYIATASDTYGNTWDASSSVTWSVNDPATTHWSFGGSTGSTISITDSSPANGWTVTATAPGGFSATAQLVVNPGTTTRLAITGYPTSINKAQSFGGVVVTAYDAYNNIATGYTGKVTFTSTDTAATLPSAYTYSATDSGVHMFAGFTLNTAGSFTITVTDNSSPQLKITTSSITVLATGNPSYSTAITPTQATAGQSVSFTYTVTRNSGANLGYATINVPAGFTAISVTSVTASNGYTWTSSIQGNVITVGASTTGLSSSGSTVVIVFTATAPNNAGTYGPFTSTVYQTNSGTGTPGTLSGTDPTVTVLPAGTQLAFTSTSQSLAVGTLSSAFKVQLEDTNGNQITTSVALSINLATSSAGGEVYSNSNGNENYEITGPITIAAGQSTSSSMWYRDLSTGSSTLTASSNGFTSATVTFTITGNNEPGYSVSISSSSQVPVGQQATFTITVTRQSSFEDDISYITITLPSSFNGVTIGSGSPTTNFGGTWNGAYSNGVITLQSRGTGDDMEDGTTNAVTITFTATPTTIGTYTFGIAVYGHLASGTTESHGMGPGTNTGSNPSLTVYTPTITSFTVTESGSQYSGTAFSISVTALDQYNNVITGFSSSVGLSVNGGPTISPTSTGTTGWSNGVWTGSVTLTGIGSTVSIKTTYGASTGTSNSFAVSLTPPRIDKSATGTSSGSSSTLTINLPATSSSNELIYITISEGSGQSVKSITPSGYNFQHRATVTLSGSNVVLETWWGVSTTASAQTITITFQGTLHSSSAIAISIIGANTASPFDTTNAMTATGSGTSATVSNSTSIGVSDLVIGNLGLDGSNTVSATGSNTLITSISSSGGRQAADEWQTVTTQSTVTSSFSWSGSTNWGIIQDAIKPA